MIDMVFGTKFWTMFARFLALPFLIWAVYPPMEFIVDAEGNGRVAEVPVWILGFHIILYSWSGWGLAFWRFGPQKAPTRYFAIYPLVTGLIFVPVTIWFVGLNTEHSVSERLLAAGFSAIVGPFMALGCVAFFRYVPNFTSLKKHVG
ncbi:MAG: hypothetical protein AAF683_01630 [Pseudomonadota bacterium]